MHIKDKVLLDRFGLEKEGPITIVAFGDSITHGALRRGEINYETVFWNLLRKRILEVSNYVPVNVINAGIGGTSAARSLDRIDKQVLSHSPDLVIVCFGLNDVNGPLEAYLSSLKIIFEKCVDSGSDVIFMTPNMCTNRIDYSIKEKEIQNAAQRVMKTVNEGWLDKYIEEAKKVCDEEKVPVCDCYSIWKKLDNSGVDITSMLSNKLNHPIKEMHWMFAYELVRTMFYN